MKTLSRIILMLLATLLVILLLLFFVFIPKESLAAPEGFPALSGPYLGQGLPGQEPVLFAPGILPRDMHTAVVFSPDGDEVYWRGLDEAPDEIVFMRLEEGRWTPPQVVPFASRFYDSDDPCFSPDGKRLYFTSWRPLQWTRMGDSRERIWFVDRLSDGWSKPKPVGPEVNSMELHWQFSVAVDETLYFSSQGDIFRAEFTDGAYLSPKKLESAINTPQREGHPFIAPDQSYLIFSSEGHPDGEGDFDLYFSNRNADGSWSQAVNLGESVNSPYQDIYPVVSPDGKALFFLSNRGGSHRVYWVAFETLPKMVIVKGDCSAVCCNDLMFVQAKKIGCGKTRIDAEKRRIPFAKG